MKDEISNFLHSRYGKSGIDGIVELIKLNYAMQNIPVAVSGTGGIIKIDLLQPDAVKEYLALRYIIEHEEDFTDEQLDEAKRQINNMKLDILDKKQSAQDRKAFLDADVFLIRYSIGGVRLIDYEIV